MTDQYLKILIEHERRDKLMIPNPSYQNLADIVGGSPGNIGYILSAMDNQGLIERGKRSNRGSTITDKGREFIQCQTK